MEIVWRRCGAVSGDAGARAMELSTPRRRVPVPGRSRWPAPLAGPAGRPRWPAPLDGRECRAQ